MIKLYYTSNLPRGNRLRKLSSKTIFNFIFSNIRKYDDNGTLHYTMDVLAKTVAMYSFWRGGSHLALLKDYLGSTLSGQS